MKHQRPIFMIIRLKTFKNFYEIFYLLIVPVALVKYCKQLAGPPMSSPHSN